MRFGVFMSTIWVFPKNPKRALQFLEKTAWICFLEAQKQKYAGVDPEQPSLEFVTRAKWARSAR